MCSESGANAGASGDTNGGAGGGAHEEQLLAAMTWLLKAVCTPKFRCRAGLWSCARADPVPMPGGDCALCGVSCVFEIFAGIWRDAYQTVGIYFSLIEIVSKT